MTDKKRLCIFTKSWEHNVRGQLAYIDHQDPVALASYISRAYHDKESKFTIDLKHQEEAPLFINDYDVLFFVGLSKAAKRLIAENHNKKFAAYGNFYDLYASNNPELLNNIDVIFDQGHFKGAMQPHHKNTFFVPYGFNHTIFYDFGTIKPNDAYKKLVIFNGSNDRFRHDRVRTKVINGLSRLGFDMEIISYHHNREAWHIRNHWTNDVEILDTAVKYSTNEWDIEKLISAACVVDIPFTDHAPESFERPEIPEREDYYNNVSYRGWGIYKYGALGCNVLTYDCAMHRALGLNETNSTFYNSNPSNIDAMVDEISTKIVNMILYENKKDKVQRQKNLRKLFSEQHQYTHRWKFMLEKVEELM